MKRNTIKISSKTTNIDLLKTLLELMTYYNLSYPIGEKDKCSVALDDKNSSIITQDVIYKCDDQLYLKLYILSNKVISNIYKLIEDEVNTE